LITLVGRAITIHGTVIAIPRNVFPEGEQRWTSHQASGFSDLIYRRDGVPTRRLSMRKVSEVLRLRFELGLEQRAIARACSISQSTVHEAGVGGGDDHVAGGESECSIPFVYAEP
jgi:hypothetical protein